MAKMRQRGLGSLLVASVALLCAAVGGTVTRSAAQIPGLSMTYLNYSMYCGNGFMVDGKRLSYCYDQETISYSSVLKTVYWFPVATSEASLFARTEKIYKVYIHGRAVAPTKEKTSFSVFSQVRNIILEDTGFIMQNWDMLSQNYPNATHVWKRYALLALKVQHVQIRKMDVNANAKALEAAGLFLEAVGNDQQDITQLQMRFELRAVNGRAGALFGTIRNNI